MSSLLRNLSELYHNRFIAVMRELVVIEAVVQRCSKCQQATKLSPPSPWPKTAAPWSHIHLDFARLVDSLSYLVVVDSPSKWLGVIVLKPVTTNILIGSLCHTFSTHGLPETIVNDNDTQYSTALSRLTGPIISSTSTFHHIIPNLIIRECDSLTPRGGYFRSNVGRDQRRNSRRVPFSASNNTAFSVKWPPSCQNSYEA